MFNFNFSESKINRVVKTVLGVKVALFLILSGVESLYDIFESVKVDDCIEEVILELKTKNIGSPNAKAIHYCEGGNLVSFDGRVTLSDD